LAVQVAYAKAARLLAEIGGVEVSARAIRRDLIAAAPDRLGALPGVVDVPVLLVDGTGERAGPDKGGVALHLAIGIVTRHTQGRRNVCGVELLAATIDEPWTVLFDQLTGINPALIVVDGEEELSTLADERFAGVPRQRCLWHLCRAVDRALRYTDRADTIDREQANRDLETILINAWAERDATTARECLDLLADRLETEGSTATATHLRNAADETFTFLTHPDAGWLVAGHKGRPDVGTGVLERVMREMNRRTDIGVRWSIPGVRAVLITKLQHKYHHGPWSPTGDQPAPPKAQITLNPPIAA
jgi:transposase-like protein